MANGTLPEKEADLVTWGENAKSHLATGFATFGLTSPQSVEFIDAFDDWKAAYDVANNTETRTKSKIAAKDDQKKLFKKAAMRMVSIVRGFSGITNELLTDLRIDIRPEHVTPIPPPGQMIVVVEGVVGNTVNVSLLGDGATTRRRAPGTKGATIVYSIGETPPVDPAAWSLSGSTNRRKFTVTFPPGTPAGTTVWIGGYWFNYRTESGEFSTPVSANLGYSGVVAAEAELKLAQAA